MTPNKNSSLRITSLALMLIAFACAIAFPAMQPTPTKAAPPTLDVFATGIGRPQAIVPTAGGDFYVVDTDAKIWSLPAAGGIGTLLATPGYSLRDGVFLPREFGPLAGQFLTLGGVATTNTPALSSTINEANTVTQYATQPSSLWTAAVVPTGFGNYTRGILALNQGSGQLLSNGSLDYFAPDGSVGRVANLPELQVPYGAVMAFGFGQFSGTVLVSDARSGKIVSVNSRGLVSPFATIPLGPGQTGLRQVAFSPHGWGDYSKNLFVSLITGEVAVVNTEGIVVGKIGGFTSPRGLRFVEIEGEPRLLICDTGNASLTPRIWEAGPEDIVPVP